MKKLTILLFSIFISLNSYGYWSYVSFGSSGNNYYIDRSSVKAPTPNTIYFYMVMDYIEPNKYGDMSLKKYKKGDCFGNKLKTLKGTYYSEHKAKGAITATLGEMDWTDTTKSEYGMQRRLLDYACAVLVGG